MRELKVSNLRWHNELQNQRKISLENYRILSEVFSADFALLHDSTSNGSKLLHSWSWLKVTLVVSSAWQFTTLSHQPVSKVARGILVFWRLQNEEGKDLCLLTQST